MAVSDDNLLRQEEERTRRGVEDRERWSDRAINEEPVLGRRGRVRLAWIAGVLLLLVLLGTLPPLVNVNRYQRRVASAIADSIGRPVHFDSITLHLLPLPGFTIQNFVVLEDPAFGAEPAMRANVVEARVRVSSLWRRRVEISRIRLEAPSVNLVRRPDGYWNLQGVVTQAGQLQSAPTAQARASAAPRFPYIEATDARVNLKLGENKLPYSLVDAKFALWLPNAQEWHVRLQGRPLRTDTDVSDVGELRVEATLGRGAGSAANEPLTLDASWKPTPMGEAGKLVTGGENYWRGEASAELHVQGTPSAMKLTSDVHLHNLRRADFVPRLPMSVDAHCEAQAAGVVHQLSGVRCVMPTAQSTSLLDAVNIFGGRDEKAAAAPDVLTLQAEVPNAMDLRSAKAAVRLQRGSAESVLEWMRLFSLRIAPQLQVKGDVSARMDYGPEQPGDHWSGSVVCHCTLPAGKGESPVAISAASRTAAVATTEGEKAVDGEAGRWLLRMSHVPTVGGPADVVAVSASRLAGDTALPERGGAALAKSGAETTGGAEIGGTAAAPVTAAVEPLQNENGPVLLSGQLSRSGYTLQYQSAALARFAASLLPPLGDDMPDDLEGGVQAERSWRGTQTWGVAATTPSHIARPAHRHGVSRVRTQRQSSQ